MINVHFGHPQEIANRLGLTWEAVSARAETLGLQGDARAALRSCLPVVEAELEGFLDDLYDRFLRVADLAPLIANDDQLQRLKGFQRQYILDLVGAEINWTYTLSRLKIGAVHHRVHLTPQWLMLTYAHIVGTVGARILVGSRNPQDALPLLITLVNSALFDATLILDAYGMVEELTLARTRDQSVSAVPDQATPQRPRHDPSVSKLPLTDEAVSERRAYVGLTTAHRARIQELDVVLQAVLPEVLKEFYEYFTSNPITAAMVPQEAVPRLERQVAAFWHELAFANFDRLHAASRVRVGVVHERIGLSPQWYMIGLARQVNGILRGIFETMPAPVESSEAFLRATFLDVAYVIDAYMEARAHRLLHAGDFASKLIAGLAAGVLVVDGDHRVVSVNRALLNFLRVDPGLLYQVPVEQALPLPEVPALLDRVATGEVVRAEANVTLGNRPFRATVFLLDSKPGLRGRPAAVVLDDMTEMTRLATEVRQDDERLLSVFQALDVVVWEMEPGTWTMEVISTSVVGLLGLRDLHFLGRPRVWLHCLAEVDRKAFERFCSRLGPGERGTIEHRMRTAAGQEIWVRTWMRRLAGSGKLAGTTVDVTDERLSEQHRQERDRANMESKAKSEFLAMMSHEVRTSLHGVLGLHDHILSGDRLPADVTMQLKVANQSAHNLLRLLNDVLDTAALDADSLTLREEEFDLVNLLQVAVLTVSPAAEAKGLSVDLFLPGEIAASWTGDAGKVLQIVNNLLSNAVKFTHAGWIRVTVIEEASGVTLAVEDTSPGVPVDRRATIFEPFGSGRSHGGSGLGLSLSRRLAALMGGSLSFEQPERPGSRFVARIPLRPGPTPSIPNGGGSHLAVLLGDELERVFPRDLLKGAQWTVLPTISKQTRLVFLDDPGQAQAIPPAIPVVICRANTEKIPALRRSNTSQLTLAPLNFSALCSALTAVARPSEPNPQSQVLVAEDDPASQQVMRLLLKRIGFEAYVVPDGFAAIEAASRKVYALILLDLYMPDVDGFQAARTIRLGGMNATTPIIAMTGHAFLQDEEACRSAGVQELLLKPVGAASLSEAIRRARSQNLQKQ